MFPVPLAAVGACLWMDAESKLKKELGREPTENEVRTRLGYPLVVGRATAHYLSLGVLPSGEVAIPGTPYRVLLTAGEGGKGIKVTLLEVPQ